VTATDTLGDAGLAHRAGVTTFGADEPGKAEL
jgi:hypothetical protein